MRSLSKNQGKIRVVPSQWKAWRSNLSVGEGFLRVSFAHLMFFLSASLMLSGRRQKHSIRSPLYIQVLCSAMPESGIGGMRTSRSMYVYKTSHHAHNLKQSQTPAARVQAVHTQGAWKIGSSVEEALVGTEGQRLHASLHLCAALPIVV